MVTVTTYLRAPDGTFQPVETSTSAPADPDYVEGAIELTIDATTIIGTEEWDYVDQLWAYIANMLLNLKTDDVASTYFPDQPIKLTFERTAEQTLPVEPFGEAIDGRG